MRRFSRFRRFSATPRSRGWFGARRSFPSTRQTNAPRLQACQFRLADTLAITNSGPAFRLTPDFIASAMSPWSHLSETGYDARFQLYGINYQSLYFVNALTAGTPGTRQVTECCEWWFVDELIDTDTPASLTQAQYGPFATLPPVAAPSTASNSDAGVLPTRTLKKTHFWLSEELAAGTLGAPDGALVIHRGSGRLRVNRRLTDRQGFFVGLFGLTSAAGIELEVERHISGTFYYRLTR